MGKGDGEGQGQGQGAGGDDWQNGICGCMNNCGNCKLTLTFSWIFFELFGFYKKGLCGWCCHPCQLGDVGQRLGESYPLFCLLGWCVPCIPYFMLRGKVRERYTGVWKILLKNSSTVYFLIDFRYNIEGSTGEDCMCAWCCGPCVGCQMANELDDRGA